jgi:hypothetical protein
VIRSRNLRGIHQKPSGRWKASISINSRSKHLGYFTTKEQAAAAYDSAARLNHGVNAVCNYDSPEDAAQAICEAIEYNALLHAGEMELIMEGLGPAQHKVGHLLGGRGCASRKSLPLCLPLITCHFYEKVRIANANRFRISATSAAPPNPVFR